MREVRELLDEATRQIPADVLRPPLARIRRRGRGRRILWPISVSGALAAIVAASALALAGPGAEPEPIPPIPVFAWSHAYAADGGRVLIIYPFRPGRCQELESPHATVSESGDAVTVTVTGEQKQMDDCTAGRAVTVTVRLGRPLGGRVLRDGARDIDRPVFREESLPVIPAGSGWTRAPSSQTLFEGDPAEWHAAYTKPGGPDVMLDIYLKGSEAPVLKPATGTIRLGTRDRALHPRGDSFQLVWEEGRHVHWLRLSPAEGERMTEERFREVVGGFTWP